MSDPTTPTLDVAALEAIEKRLNAATQWTPDQCEIHREPPDADFPDGYVYAPQGAALGDTLVRLDDTYEGSGEDWDFLAHAQVDIRALVTALRAAQADAEKWRGCATPNGNEAAQREIAQFAHILAKLSDAKRDALTEARRNVAAMKVIARHYHDEHGNRVRAGYDGIDEIGDILCGLRDDEIAAEIEATLAAKEPTP